MGDDTDPPVMLAAIAGAHGVGGEVRLKLFAENADSLKQHKRLEAGGRTLVLKGLKQAGKSLVARFDGVTNRNEAEALRGTPLTVPRSALPPPQPDEVYIVDLIGRPVQDAAGNALGRVAAVENFGAGDILDIERPGGARFMVPFSREAVPEIGSTLIVADDFLPQD